MINNLLSVNISIVASFGTEIRVDKIAIASAQHEDGHKDVVEVNVIWGEEVSIWTNPKYILHEGNDKSMSELSV